MPLRQLGADRRPAGRVQGAAPPWCGPWWLPWCWPGCYAGSARVAPARSTPYLVGAVIYKVAFIDRKQLRKQLINLRRSKGLILLWFPSALECQKLCKFARKWLIPGASVPKTKTHPNQSKPAWLLRFSGSVWNFAGDKTSTPPHEPGLIIIPLACLANRAMSVRK